MVLIWFMILLMCTWRECDVVLDDAYVMCVRFLSFDVYLVWS